ncbi:MAG: EamA family transporter, partial [Chloroflexota bacterium]|nr:EamA family transporter [Chloroflexota bacterium]
VYPLARGTAPLLAVLAGIILLGERLSPIALGGVVLLLAGIWAVRRPAPAGAGTIPALLTGVCIAAYSTVDAAGVQLTAPWLYGYLESLLTAALLALWVGVVHGTASDQPPPTWKLSALVGSMMTFAYLLVLFAFRIAPLAVVSPLRESAIVLVTIWGAWRLRERDGLWLRLAGASIIVLGVGLLATT